MSWASLLTLLSYCILHSPLVFTISGDGNVTSLDPEGRQGRVSLISCNRGCCPESSDGCCYRTTVDIIVYTVPVCVFLALIVVILCCIFKRLRDNRRRELEELNKQAQDNPPSYSSVVHPVSSTATLTIAEPEATVEVYIHPPPVEEEENGNDHDGNGCRLLPPPPVYDDIFKRVENDQVPVVSSSGHVSFVDHALVPAIKISLSQNDLQSKLLEGMRQCRSSTSLTANCKAGVESEDIPNGNVPAESCENRVFFSLGAVEQNTPENTLTVKYE